MRYFIMLLTLVLFSLSSCSQSNKATDQQPIASKPKTLGENGLEKMIKTDAEWKKILSPEAYRILREQGTERAFTGKYWDNKLNGTYSCTGCQLPLFSSEAKFKSGTGWPSFYQPIREAHIIEIQDRSHGMVRTEVVCGRCEGHLGHLFTDGPPPTGFRYCINGNVLDFEKGEKK